MLKRKTFLKKKTSRDISASRNLRLRRLNIVKQNSSNAMHYN